MRPRASGGMEPDDADQRELVELWHLSKPARSGDPFGVTRDARLAWVIVEFLKARPGSGFKWVYVWCERYLGRLVDPNPIPVPDWMDGPTGSTTGGHAKIVPKRGPRSASKKRAI